MCALLLNTRLLKQRSNNKGILEYDIVTKSVISPGPIQLLLLLLLKKVSSTRLGESDIHPISPKTPAPQYQPIDRKKRKGKRVEEMKTR